VDQGSLPSTTHIAALVLSSFSPSSSVGAYTHVAFKGDAIGLCPPATHRPKQPHSADGLRGKPGLQSLWPDSLVAMDHGLAVSGCAGNCSRFRLPAAFSIHPPEAGYRPSEARPAHQSAGLLDFGPAELHSAPMAAAARGSFGTPYAVVQAVRCG